MKNLGKSRISAFFFLCCFAVSSCINKKSNTAENEGIPYSYPHTININEGLNNRTELRLSDLADSIKYIVLSKEKTVAVNFVFYVALTDNNIIAAVSQCPFLRFTPDGKFLDTIGHFGRGPDEYMPGSKFTIDPVSNEIIVYRNFLHDFVRYNSDGKFIDKHPLQFGYSIESFECLSGSRFALFPVYDGREIVDNNIRKDMIFIGLFDQNGNKLSGKGHPAQDIPSDFVPSRFIMGSPVNRNTYFNNEVVTPCYENSVYKINSDSIYTGFTINWDRLPVPRTFEEKYYFNSSASNFFAEIRSKFIETTKHAFFILNYENTKYLIEYNKHSGQTSSMSFPDQNRIGFINDLDGGQQFFPLWTNRSGDIWIDFVEAVDLKSQYTNDLLQDNEAGNPDNKQKLIDFVKNLELDDNPVLRLVYLKQVIGDR